jgi:colanic acid/amylovoran biosynthesis glycosyltransferase
MPVAHTDDLLELRTTQGIGPVGYIVSLSDGIPSFIDREINGLMERGVDINLYATKIGRGVYNPNVPFVPLSLRNLFFGNVFFLLARPRTYLRCLRKAAKLHSTKEMFAGAAFARTLMKRKTRLIHSAFGDRKLFVGYYASELVGIPLTTMIHSHELAIYIDAPTFAVALAKCSKVMTVCEWNLSVLAARFGQFRDKMTVVRLFVDPEAFKQDRRTKILTVAKFHNYKGYDVLAKTAGILKDKNVVFWIVGNGPVDVAQMMKDEGADQNTVFFGAVSEEVLKTLYQHCDIFCLPSKTAPTGQKEGLPVSLMEAMAYSKPIVSTKHAGIPELVPSKLVNEDDPQQLADALMLYISDPSSMKSDGTRNRAIVESEYSPKNLEQLREIFIQSERS